MIKCTLVSLFKLGSLREGIRGLAQEHHLLHRIRNPRFLLLVIFEAQGR